MLQRKKVVGSNPLRIKDINGIESNDHENNVSGASKRLCLDVKKPQGSPFDLFQGHLREGLDLYVRD